MSGPLLPVYSTSISGMPSSSTTTCKRGRSNEATVLGRRPSSAEIRDFALVQILTIQQDRFVG